MGPNSRRLYGFPAEWPDHADAGHFIIEDASWLVLDKENSQCDLPRIERILVRAVDVEMVEFAKEADGVDDPNTLINFRLEQERKASEDEE